MAFGSPRSSCVRPGAHSALRQDSRNDLTLCRMALHVVSAGAHAPHSDETPGPTATRGSSHSARRLRSLAFLCSSAALRAPAGTSPADNAVLNDLTLDHHLDHLASLCEHRSGDLGAVAHARTGPRQRDDHSLIGVIG